MLLSSLSILMGAILVPSDYFWMYSTHIALMCLYLIWSKRLIVLFLTFVSFVPVLFGEIMTAPPEQDIRKGDAIWVNSQTREAYIGADALSLPLIDSVSLVHFTLDGRRIADRNYTLYPIVGEPADNSSLLTGRISAVLLPDKQGPWWQRELYINRQVIQLTVEFPNESVRTFSATTPDIRERLLIHLDTVFESFESWRFTRALLLGNDGLWSERDTWMVRTLGLAHLFVVSGLHTGFMFVIGCLLSKIVWCCLPNALLLTGFTRWHCDALLVIPLLFSYAYLTHWGEPVVRASIMLTVYLLARMQAVKLSPYTIITFALWVVLMFNPRSILSPGLWLSFSMVYLLIGYCQTSSKWSRLVFVQFMLSTASMVLVLGWQEAISILSIFVNILLIPFSAFIWFPWALLSGLEVILAGSAIIYGVLDLLLRWVLSTMELIVFHAPLLPFDKFFSSTPKWIMLFLIVYWVYQSPLKRGVLSALGIWCILFSSLIDIGQKADLSLKNTDNALVLFNQSGLVFSNGWAQRGREDMMLGRFLNKPLEGYMLSPNSFPDLTPSLLLLHDVKWLLLGREAPQQFKVMLEALDVDWLVLAAGQSLDFYFENNRIALRHSACFYSFFLLKSDTCKRVEKLESMLNYKQT